MNPIIFRSMGRGFAGGADIAFYVGDPEEANKSGCTEMLRVLPERMHEKQFMRHPEIQNPKSAIGN